MLMTIAYSLHDRVAAARVCAAFGSARARGTEPAEVRALVEALGTCAAVLFDLQTVGWLGMPYFDRLRARRRTAALILYLPPGGGTARAAFQLARCGIDGVCVQNEDDTPALLRRVVDDARARAAADHLSAHLADLAPGFGSQAWATVLARVPELRTAADVAAVLGTTPQRLRTTLREAGLPCTRRFLAWCRLLSASALLEDSARTTEAVGLAVSYASGPAFRNACQYLAGVQPREIRRRGGAAFVIERLRIQVGAREPFPDRSP